MFVPLVTHLFGPAASSDDEAVFLIPAFFLSLRDGKPLFWVFSEDDLSILRVS